ncbi:MAG: NTP transferase domain-containing protein [Magnetococcales bacterium]|nr:NTP transferase domain-containing protein [Magnetococcales bacterium]MBF0321431.1 NTP transferase domain-containing protein [Magnetococcales bacterium]
MQIIIPMSGFGARFQKAGYTVPKPLIPVDGKPIIAHVLDLFPGEEDVTFVCNRQHLEDPTYHMAELLREFCPSGRILAIEPHKLGPVYAVAQVMDQVDLRRPTIVNYCDFTCYWDYNHFKEFVDECSCDGAIPAYRGFHPHSLGSTFYAYLREQGGWLLDIQEKQPFTNNPMQEYASSGTYYFASGEIMRHCFQRAMDEGQTVGGEYYVSLAYKPMLAECRAVAVYELQHFMQWGTPEMLEEYQHWSSVFNRLAQPLPSPAPRHEGTVLVPMAGLGSRFSREGFTVSKPLIPVSGQPMVVQATHDLPKAERYRFVVRRDMLMATETRQALEQAFRSVEVVSLDELTDGQARTCLLGMEGVALDQPVTIGASDNGALYDPAGLVRLLEDPETDLIVWVVRGHAGAARHPEMYGWVMTEGSWVTGVSVKTPLGDPARDPVILGTFTFKRAGDFVAATQRMIHRGARINGEFYVDTCINDALALGLSCQIFAVDHYLCWGTPDELRTFEYWQSCFHKWNAHPYRLEKDPRVPAEAVSLLAERYRPTLPRLLGVRT